MSEQLAQTGGGQTEVQKVDGLSLLFPKDSERKSKCPSE